jgi:hypothetical protein
VPVSVFIKTCDARLGTTKKVDSVSFRPFRMSVAFRWASLPTSHCYFSFLQIERQLRRTYQAEKSILQQDAIEQFHIYWNQTVSSWNAERSANPGHVRRR